MDWLIYPFLAISGIIAGFINTIAGSGSIISIAILMFMGLDANIANGTNRIGILLQSITAVGSFKKQQVFKWKEGLYYSLPAVTGSVIGALSATKITSNTLELVIGGLMIFMLFVLIYKPENWIKGKSGKIKESPNLVQIVIFFIIGLYGGFIQVGVGFFLLTGLVLGAGLDLVKANAIKSLIVSIYTPFALAVFIYQGQVDYLLGTILGVGGMLGAYIASRLAVKKGAKFVHFFLIMIIILFAAYLFGLFNFLIKLFGT